MLRGGRAFGGRAPWEWGAHLHGSRALSPLAAPFRHKLFPLVHLNALKGFAVRRPRSAAHRAQPPAHSRRSSTAVTAHTTQTHKYCFVRRGALSRSRRSESHRQPRSHYDNRQQCNHIEAHATRYIGGRAGLLLHALSWARAWASLRRVSLMQPSLTLPPSTSSQEHACSHVVCGRSKRQLFNT